MPVAQPWQLARTPATQNLHSPAAPVRSLVGRLAKGIVESIGPAQRAARAQWEAPAGGRPIDNSAPTGFAELASKIASGAPSAEAAANAIARATKKANKAKKRAQNRGRQAYTPEN